MLVKMKNLLMTPLRPTSLFIPPIYETFLLVNRNTLLACGSLKLTDLKYQTIFSYQMLKRTG